MKIPKGRILIIGGAEYKDDGRDLPMVDENHESKPFEILKQLLPAPKSKSPIIIIPTASRIPEEMGKSYLEAFGKLDFHNIHVMDIRDREDANRPDLVEVINKAHAVLFTGGSQLRLSTIVGDSFVLNTIKEKYWNDPDFIVAGTSAGSMALSKIMIIEGQTSEAMIKGDLKTSSGLGFIDHIIIDTHFVKRGRFGRLTQAIITNPEYFGVGLGEDTALMITKGDLVECMGSGMVMIIIDGASSRYTNIAEIENQCPISVENLKVHILTTGDCFKLDEKKFIPRIPIKQHSDHIKMTNGVKHA
ncbi:MAG: cyanophycinase [Bacillota bacterium]